MLLEISYIIREPVADYDSYISQFDREVPFRGDSGGYVMCVGAYSFVGHLRGKIGAQTSQVPQTGIATK